MRVPNSWERHPHYLRRLESAQSRALSSDCVRPLISPVFHRPQVVGLFAVGAGPDMVVLVGPGPGSLYAGLMDKGGRDVGDVGVGSRVVKESYH
jgi:hypothetical protein